MPIPGPSGLYNATRFSIAQLMEHGAAQAGLAPGAIPARLAEAMPRILTAYAAEIQARGTTLWAVQRELLGVFPGRAIALPEGVFDVRERGAYWRTATRPEAIFTCSTAISGSLSNLGRPYNESPVTALQTNASIIADLGTAQWITGAGVQAATAQTWDLVVEVSNNLVTWTAINNVRKPMDVELPTVIPGEWIWRASGGPIFGRYARLRERGGALISLLSFVPVVDATEIEMTRLSAQDYMALPNKQPTVGSGLPQFFLDRGTDLCRMRLWPVPGTTDTEHVSVWVERSWQTVNEINQQVETPTRWAAALLAGVSHRVALELPGVSEQRLDRLERRATQLEIEAGRADRDRTPVLFAADISAYTR